MQRSQQRTTAQTEVWEWRRLGIGHDRNLTSGPRSAWGAVLSGLSGLDPRHYGAQTFRISSHGIPRRSVDSLRRANISIKSMALAMAANSERDCWSGVTGTDRRGLAWPRKEYLSRDGETRTKPVLRLPIPWGERAARVQACSSPMGRQGVARTQSCTGLHGSCTGSCTLGKTKRPP
jgi:hypothetical protein